MPTGLRAHPPPGPPPLRRRRVPRRAKIQPEMAATLYPLKVPPIPWHKVGLDYLRHLHVSNGFDNVMIAVDHLARTARFIPCT
jgi:hypothetical protein